VNAQHKAIAIEPVGTGRAAGTKIREVTIGGLADMQAIVKGLIEPVDLSNGVTMYVNEEGLYQFEMTDQNWVAADVAALGGVARFMFGQPLLGPALLIGFDPESGDSADVPDVARRWCKRVGREAGAVFENGEVNE
jgi:hypothetical protein